MADQQLRLASLTEQLQTMVEEMRNLSTETESHQTSDPPSGLPDIMRRLSSLEVQVDEVQRALQSLQNTSDEDRLTLVALRDDLNARNAEKHNSDAKAYNKRVNDAMKLLPFHDPATNQPIAGFPKTIQAIRHMQDTDLDRILRTLNADYYPYPFPGRTVDKQARMIVVVKGLQDPTYLDRIQQAVPVDNMLPGMEQRLAE